MNPPLTSPDSDSALPSRSRTDWLNLAGTVTPARLLTGRAGTGYRTPTQLELRRDHAAAQDAVLSEFHLQRDFPEAMIQEWGLFEVESQAHSRSEFLLRPDLGRKLSAEAEESLRQKGTLDSDVQVLLGDGLSAAALRVQGPVLLPELMKSAQACGLKSGRPLTIRNCRVGILNEIGRVLNPEVVVLLIGERPGLATAESLGAYLAWRPRPGHTDAHRNLVSNIHSRGVQPGDAIRRILGMVTAMRRQSISGPALMLPI